jgi:hypothetical protein
MIWSRRSVLAAGAASAFAPVAWAQSALPDTSDLKPITGDAVPIGPNGAIGWPAHRH